MKDFSDLLDIDTKLLVEVKFGPITGNGNPFVQVVINDQMFYDSWLKTPVKIVTKVDLFDPIFITVIMSEKIYSERRETAVIVDNISIDGVALLPRFNHLIAYHPMDPYDPDMDLHTPYIGINGLWSLNINKPFHHWLHEHSGQGWLLETLDGM